MKITLKGRLGDITKQDGNTNITLSLKGKVDAEGLATTAKESLMLATLHIREVVADKLKIGQDLIVTIETDDTKS